MTIWVDASIKLVLQWKADGIHLHACTTGFLIQKDDGVAPKQALVNHPLGTGLRVWTNNWSNTCEISWELISSPECPNDCWIKFQKITEPTELVYASISNGLESFCIWDIHQSSGHPGVKCTLYFVRMINPGVLKTIVREVVRNYDQFQSIDPAPVHWKMGRLDVSKN